MEVVSVEDKQQRDGCCIAKRKLEFKTKQRKDTTHFEYDKRCENFLVMSKNLFIRCLPSSVCWSSSTWFISLVFSSCSTWFSISPKMIHKDTQTLVVNTHKIKLQKNAWSCGWSLPSISQFMVPYWSSILSRRAVGSPSAVRNVFKCYLTNMRGHCRPFHTRH